MADWDSADLLRRFKDEAGLEDASEMSDDNTVYPLLSDAQEEVVREVAARYPAALYTEPVALVAIDATLKTFRWPQVNGQDVLPMGAVQIAPRLSAFTSDRDFVGWDVDIEFLDEGTRIRIPGDRAFSGTLYARYVPRPPRMTALVGPSIRPIEASTLIVNRAVRKWAKQGNQRPDIKKEMDEEWAKDFPVWMLTWRRRHRGGARIMDPARWYLASPDLSGGAG